METIIPILIALVVFAFQAYANFQKEQDKARKRNPAQRRPPADPDIPVTGDVTQSKTSPTRRYRDEKPIDRPAAHRDKPEPAWPVDVQTTTSEFEAYTGQVNTAEIRKQRKVRNRQTPEHVEITDSENSVAGMPVDGFDLRDAVIKSVILERPYR